MFVDVSFVKKQIAMRLSDVLSLKVTVYSEVSAKHSLKNRLLSLFFLSGN